MALLKNTSQEHWRVKMGTSKEILIVFQDCPLCGNRGKLLKNVIATEGLKVRKVSFASEEGRELIHKAVMEHGIGRLPFFTDGERFSIDIRDFVEKDEPIEKLKKKKTARTRKKKGVEDESDR